MGQRKENVTQVGPTQRIRGQCGIFGTGAACLKRISCFDSKLTLGGKARKKVCEQSPLKATINYSSSR